MYSLEKCVFVNKLNIIGRKYKKRSTMSIKNIFFSKNHSWKH